LALTAAARDAASSRLVRGAVHGPVEACG